MLIKFDTIVKKYGLPKGIIHLGAHLAEELEDYLEHKQDNVIWVEANPNLYENLKDRISNTKHLAFCHLLSDLDDKDMKFNIAKNYYNGNYQSSSVLEFGTHEINHPHIKMENSIYLKSKTVKTIFSENNLNFENYDFVNLDLQGYELPVIKGFGEYISKMKYIYTEINTEDVYKNCSKLYEVDDYLKNFGFERVETYMTDANWGDALYIKIDQKQKIIFDIGANIGGFTDKCLDDYPDSKILMVEPNNNLVIRLINKYKNNRNINIIDKLVSSISNQLLDFYISDADTISTANKDWIENSRFSKNYRWDVLIKKETINLDDLIKLYGNPDIIKIDVEGYELEVVKGLTSKQKEICFEWAEEQYDNINKTCEYLIKLGYENFGFTYGDDFLKRPSIFSSWKDCEIHNNIDINRKEKWGMIWVK